MKIVFDGKTKKVVSESEAKRLTADKKSPWKVVDDAIVKVNVEAKEKHAAEVEERKKARIAAGVEAAKALKKAEKQAADEDAARIKALKAKRKAEDERQAKEVIEREERQRVERQNAERERLENEKHQRQLDLQAAQAQNKK